MYSEVDLERLRRRSEQDRSAAARVSEATQRARERKHKKVSPGQNVYVSEREMWVRACVKCVCVCVCV